MKGEGEVVVDEEKEEEEAEEGGWGDECARGRAVEVAEGSAALSQMCSKLSLPPLARCCPERDQRRPHTSCSCACRRATMWVRTRTEGVRRGGLEEQEEGEGWRKGRYKAH